ncbi:hypothetical protein ABZS83_02215 [Streptomyces sp. NPDC005426]|uniref:hypothetical protein n=1 Tax=Streptomyces sp. NPDC005426 TaxID=3155344 RepID=UPI0033AB84A5
MQELADRYAEVMEKMAATTEELAKERAAGVTFRRIIAELSLELDQAREQLGQSGNVARLPAPRRQKSRQERGSG